VAVARARPRALRAHAAVPSRGRSLDSAGVRRVVVWIAVVITSLLLQSTVFAQIQLGGAKPDLIYLITVVLAYLEGPSSGALAGFAGGMAEDFLLNQPVGGFGELLRVALLAAAYNAVLTPILFPVVRRVAESSRTPRAFRW